MAVDRLVWKILLDFVLMACMAFALLSIELWMEPYRRGFFVQDLDIRLPYKDQTVNEVMTSFGVVIVILTILIVEIVRDKQGKGTGEKFLCGRLIAGWVWETYCCVGVFLFGLACQHLLTFTSKSVIGRLRPHFYDVCMPVYNASDPVNVQGYIVEYSCLQPDERSIREAHMSFPSGHASYSMCCAVFFIVMLRASARAVERVQDAAARGPVRNAAGRVVRGPDARAGTLPLLERRGGRQRHRGRRRSGRVPLHSTTQQVQEPPDGRRVETGVVSAQRAAAPRASAVTGRRRGGLTAKACGARHPGNLRGLNTQKRSHKDILLSLFIRDILAIFVYVNKYIGLLVIH